MSISSNHHQVEQYATKIGQILDIYSRFINFLIFVTIRLMFDTLFEDRHHESASASVILFLKLHRNASFNRHTERNSEKLDSIEWRSLPKNVTNYCPEVPPGLRGSVKPITKPAPSFEALLDEFKNYSFQADGRCKPEDCISRFKVAIIVPYRSRFEHLNIFLRNIHPFLSKQLLDYTIFIVEQAGDGPFNRGMLLNIGFEEAMKIRRFDCFIFHDVDLLPEDDRNIYNCPKQPRHMSVAINVFEYKLPYTDIFGGISAMSAEHFQLVNGYSNMFWGWGGEDDDMSMRIKMKGLHLARYRGKIARYTMLPHEKQKINPFRFEKLYLGRKRFEKEGLKTLKYQRLELRPCKLFTWILVELRPAQRENWFIAIVKNSIGRFIG